MGTCFDAATICGESQLEALVNYAITMVTYFDDCEVSKRVILQNLNVPVARRAKLWVERCVSSNLTLGRNWSKLEKRLGICFFQNTTSEQVKRTSETAGMY